MEPIAIAAIALCAISVIASATALCLLHFSIKSRAVHIGAPQVSKEESKAEALRFLKRMNWKLP